MAMEIDLLAAFIGGLVSFFSPCVVPLMPVFIIYLTGTKLDSSKKNKIGERGRVFAHAAAFVIGFSIIFILLGVLLGLLSESIPVFRTILSEVGGILIIAFGLQTLSLIELPFLSVPHKISTKRAKPSYLGSLMIGGAFAIGWTPCVSGILASILVLAGVNASAASGAILLAAYSAGFAIPFLVLGYFTSEATEYIKNHEQLFSTFNLIAGVLLIILGILVFTERFQEVISRFI